jgi:hypothetical protein
MHCEEGEEPRWSWSQAKPTCTCMLWVLIGTTVALPQDFVYRRCMCREDTGTTNISNEDLTHYSRVNDLLWLEPQVSGRDSSDRETQQKPPRSPNADVRIMLTEMQLIAKSDKASSIA